MALLQVILRGAVTVFPSHEGMSFGVAGFVVAVLFSLVLDGFTL